MKLLKTVGILALSFVLIGGIALADDDIDGSATLTISSDYNLTLDSANNVLEFSGDAVSPSSSESYISDEVQITIYHNDDIDMTSENFSNLNDGNGNSITTTYQFLYFQDAQDETWDPWPGVEYGDGEDFHFAHGQAWEKNTLHYSKTGGQASVRVRAVVNRDGWNDPAGEYTAQLNFNYSMSG